jgi:hypothetical protein
MKIILDIVHHHMLLFFQFLKKLWLWTISIFEEVMTVDNFNFWRSYDCEQFQFLKKLWLWTISNTLIIVMTVQAWHNVSRLSVLSTVAERQSPASYLGGTWFSSENGCHDRFLLFSPVIRRISEPRPFSSLFCQGIVSSGRDFECMPDFSRKAIQSYASYHGHFLSHSTQIIIGIYTLFSHVICL